VCKDDDNSMLEDNNQELPQLVTHIDDDPREIVINVDDRLAEILNNIEDFKENEERRKKKVNEDVERILGSPSYKAVMVVAIATSVLLVAMAIVKSVLHSYFGDYESLLDYAMGLCVVPLVCIGSPHSRDSSYVADRRKLTYSRMSDGCWIFAVLWVVIIFIPVLTVLTRVQYAIIGLANIAVLVYDRRYRCKH
jgi:hypothetical protein